MCSRLNGRLPLSCHAASRRASPQTTPSRRSSPGTDGPGHRSPQQAGPRTRPCWSRCAQRRAATCAGRSLALPWPHHHEWRRGDRTPVTRSATGCPASPCSSPCRWGHMEQRERRRDLTYRAAVRAQREHLKVVHPDGTLDCPCEQSPMRFSKRRGLACPCRSRRHGQPKLGRGPCCRHKFRPRFLRRSAWRQERHRWLAGLVADDLKSTTEARS